jgi:hypothetical protein
MRRLACRDAKHLTIDFTYVKRPQLSRIEHRISNLVFRRRA